MGIHPGWNELKPADSPCPVPEWRPVLPLHTGDQSDIFTIRRIAGIGIVISLHRSGGGITGFALRSNGNLINLRFAPPRSEVKIMLRIRRPGWFSINTVMVGYTLQYAAGNIHNIYFRVTVFGQVRASRLPSGEKAGALLMPLNWASTLRWPVFSSCR